MSRIDAPRARQARDAPGFVIVPASSVGESKRGGPKGLVDAVRFALASIGRDLSRHRRQARMSQAEVAARAGIRVETLSRLENGRGNPTVATVTAILHALDAGGPTPRGARSKRGRRRAKA